jgi:hypothetical protein
MNSKIEVRIEALRLAASLKNVDRVNVIHVAREIEEYIMDGIELPDIYDPNTYMKELVDKLEQIKFTEQPSDFLTVHKLNKKSPMPYMDVDILKARNVANLNIPPEWEEEEKKLAALKETEENTEKNYADVIPKYTQY